MNILSEVMQTYWTNKWADTYGLDRKYADNALKMIGELETETDFDEDLIQAVVLSSYPLNPPESIFDKFEKGKGSKNAGKSVKFITYTAGLKQ